MVEYQCIDNVNISLNDRNLLNGQTNEQTNGSIDIPNEWNDPPLNATTVYWLNGNHVNELVQIHIQTHNNENYIDYLYRLLLLMTKKKENTVMNNMHCNEGWRDPLTFFRYLYGNSRKWWWISNIYHLPLCPLIIYSIGINWCKENYFGLFFFWF